MDAKAALRLAPVFAALLAIAACTCSFQLGEEQQPLEPAALLLPPTSDPLRAELSRCTGLGEAAARDPACLESWAKNRRRFLGFDRPKGAAAPKPEQVR